MHACETYPCIPTYAYKVGGFVKLVLFLQPYFFLLWEGGVSQAMSKWMDGESDRGGTSFRGERGWALDGGKRDMVR